jgi:N-acetylmuramoyl-L-alanine amidase
MDAGLLRALVGIVCIGALTSCHGQEAAAPDPEEEQASAQVEVNPKDARTSNSRTKRSSAHAFVVALDAGHSKKKGGAVSSHGIDEYRFNRRVVAELFAVLESSKSISPMLVNAEGEEIRLTNRAVEANDAGADLFLSIHHDSVKDQFLKTWKIDGKAQKFTDQFRGYSVFYSRKNARATESLSFAEMLGAALRHADFTPTLHHAEQEHRPIVDATNGVYAFDDLIVLKTATMPAVLLECGVILNPDEEEQLDSQAVRKRLERAITSALEQFAGQRSERPNLTPRE